MTYKENRKTLLGSLAAVGLGLGIGSMVILALHSYSDQASLNAGVSDSLDLNCALGPFEGKVTLKDVKANSEYPINSYLALKYFGADGVEIHALSEQANLDDIHFGSQEEMKFSSTDMGLGKKVLFSLVVKPESLTFGQIRENIEIKGSCQ